jgi:hypothetical protein
MSFTSLNCAIINKTVIRTVIAMRKANLAIIQGVYIMFSVITNIYNKKTEGPNLMKLFTAAKKTEKAFFLQLEMFDV